MSSSDVQTIRENPAAEEILGGSFRDPSGWVFRHEGAVYRRVNYSYQAAYERLMRSGLYEELVAAGLLVPHAEIDLPGAVCADAYKVLKPEAIGCVSYPYEWCFSQLKAAAQATLAIQRAALGHGMTLKDASAYNIQFRRGRPVLIDTLSFEPDTDSAWVAYRQFVQHFLAPLALMRYGDVRLGQLSRVCLDGVPLDLASRLLPLRTRWRWSLLLHVHLHAGSQRRYADVRLAAQLRQQRLSRAAREGLLDSLAAAVERLRLPDDRTTWSDYATAHHYAEETYARKMQVVEAMLREAAPAVVWDLGANTGIFSRIASRLGASVVAFEMDHACVETNYRAVVQGGEENILPLILDLANPSPALGWGHAERMSLAQRGPADTVLALALVHHLALSNNVPFDRLAAYFAGLGRSLIIEFVPKQDPMAQKLLQNRDDVFPGYTRDAFERAFQRYFAIRQVTPLPASERVLYLLERCHAA